MLDLEACHDRQMPAISGIVRELLGVDRYAIQLTTNVVSTFRHFISAGFRLSDKSHGGLKEELVGTRQRNMASGAICRDQSCLVFKELEKMKRGLLLILLLAAQRVRRTQVAQVNDADFYSNG